MSIHDQFKAQLPKLRPPLVLHDPPKVEPWIKDQDHAIDLNLPPCEACGDRYSKCLGTRGQCRYWAKWLKRRVHWELTYRRYAGAWHHEDGFDELPPYIEPGEIL